MSAFFNGNVSEATVFEWDASGKLLQVYKTGKSGKTGNALLDAANAFSIAIGVLCAFCTRCAPISAIT